MASAPSSADQPTAAASSSVASVGLPAVDTDDDSAREQLEGDAALAARLQQEEDQRQREDAVDAADAELAARLQLEEDSWREQRSGAGQVLLEGLVEKKPVRGLGMVERGLFGQGWRARRVLLRCQSREEAVALGNLSEPGGAMAGGTSEAVAVIEWHHTDADESEPSCLVLDPACTRVRRGGDPGDEVDCCVTVESFSQSLVLRMSGVDERDAWLSGIGRCLKRLQAAAFDERVGEAVQRLGQFGDEAALRRASRREGVQLLMERFFGACAVDAGGEGELSSAASGAAAEEAWIGAMVEALLRCLLTRQAEERLRTGRRSAPPEECERRELQLFPWHYEVARRFEEATWQLRDALAARTSLASLAELFDYTLGISQPFDFGGSWAPRDDPPERWVAFRRAFHEASMQRVLELALPVPEHLAALSDALARRYEALQPGEVLTLTPTDTNEEAAALQVALELEDEGGGAAYPLPSSPPTSHGGAGDVLGGGRGGRRPGCVRCEVVRRMTGSSTQPLLLSVEALTPASRGAPGTAAAAAAASAASAAAAGTADEDAAAAPVMWSAAGERVFFKVGDDLRQDLAALLLLDEANALWREAGLRCSTRTYRVVPTATRRGFIECLENAVPISHESGAAFVWSRTLHDSAVGAFTAGFVLGLGDRHQDNMLLCGPDRDVFAHIDFGYVAGSRPWFDANLLPIPERFMNCCVEAKQWHQFVRDMGNAFAVLQAGQPQLCAVAAALAEPLSGVNYADYISRCLQTHRAEDMMALVEAAPHDLARRFKNLHHKLSHHGL